MKKTVSEAKKPDNIAKLITEDIRTNNGLIFEDDAQMKMNIQGHFEKYCQELVDNNDEFSLEDFLYHLDDLKISHPNISYQPAPGEIDVYDLMIDSGFEFEEHKHDEFFVKPKQRAMNAEEAAKEVERRVVNPSYGSPIKRLPNIGLDSSGRPIQRTHN